MVADIEHTLAIQDSTAGHSAHTAETTFRSGRTANSLGWKVMVAKSTRWEHERAHRTDDSRASRVPR